MNYPLHAAACLATTALVSCMPSRAIADDAFWYLQGSVYTRHFGNNQAYNNRQDLIGLERNLASGVIAGAATFRNSFSQRSWYAYAGKRLDLPASAVYFKLSAGLIHGYKGKYRDKLPFNQWGIAPALIPGVGAHWGPVAGEVVVLGLAATMVNVGLRF